MFLTGELVLTVMNSLMPFFFYSFMILVSKVLVQQLRTCSLLSFTDFETDADGLQSLASFKSYLPNLCCAGYCT
jgi:hypothetical protein